MLLYKNTEDRIFHLIAFNDLHQQILFRRYKYYPGEHNIDILFKGVMSMNILAEYKGLRVSVVEKRKGETCRTLPSLHYIFELTDNTNILSYIEGAVFGVFHNYHPLNQSSILDLTPENKMVYWSKDDVNSFVKTNKK